MSTYLYDIAGHGVRITFASSAEDEQQGQKQVNDVSFLPSFNAFMVDALPSPPIFTLTIDDTLQPIPKAQRNRIRAFDTGNGETVVDEIEDGGYQFIIKNADGRGCCLLQCDKDFSSCSCALNGNARMRIFGLNNAIMLVYAFAASHHDTLLIHASLVRHAGRGYAFIAKSGTGKSTQVSMWLRHIPDCDLMNDDNPIIRIINGEAFIYGSPWSGKTPCYRGVSAPLGAITRIDRAAENSIERLKPVDAFASVLPSCSAMKWDIGIFRRICDTVTRVVERVPIYTLHCLPDKESAEICNKAIAQ